MNTERRRGLTLIELIVCTVIIGVLSGVALPLSQHFVRLQKETLLRENLRLLREGIDRFRDRQAKRNPDWSEDSCYPVSLDDLVRERVLRRVPTDPLTRAAAWRTISSTDQPGISSTDGRNIFDVRSLAPGAGADGTPYADW